MKSRLSSVQQALFLLLSVSLVFCLLARPHPENRRYMDALDEMTHFRDGFRRGELERSLLVYARAAGALPLATLQRAIGGQKVPAVQLANAAQPLQPTAAISLATLAEVHARAQPKSTLAIGVVARPEPLAESVAWRLARSGGEAWTLTAVELENATLGQTDVDLEREVAKLRIDALAAQQAVDDATKKLETAEQVFELRRKWKLPWKVLVKSDEARKEARAALAERQRTLDEIRKRYESSAARALAVRPKAALNSPAVQPYAIAKVHFQQNGAQRTLDVPVALELRQTPLPTLQGGEFPAARAAGLWSELKDLNPDQAIDAIRRHFNWHYRYVELLGIRFGGMTVLQLLPCLLPVLLALLLLRIRAVSTSYNPFGTTLDSALPRVGFRNRSIECLVLVILPVLAAALAATSLLLVGQVPALPVLTAVACLLLGGYAFSKLGELQSLVEAVVRSHSSYPPADEK